MTCTPNTVAVFGKGIEPVDVVLRYILKLKDHKAPVVVLDYTGRGAVALNSGNQMSLMRHPVTWYNTADRRRPVALFQLRRSDHFRRVFSRALRNVQRVSGFDVSNNTLDWAVEAAFNLARGGTVGLGALLKSLAAPETRRWFQDTHQAPAEIANLVRMLRWTMGFSSIFSVSESNNRSGLSESLANKGVLWIEVPAENFEGHEYALMVCLIDAAVEDAIKTALSHDRQYGVQRGMMTVAHLFPPSGMSSSMPEWVNDTAGSVKHVAVHSLPKSQSLSPLQLSWASEASAIWVTGCVAPLMKSAHAGWLSREEEEQINRLDQGKVWIRQNSSGKIVTASVRTSRMEIGAVHNLRTQSAHKRKLLMIQQA